MLTRCPQCATAFRVSPQQLKVHQGEVRCGRCSTVFDAFESLVPEPASSSQAPPEVSPSAPPPKAAPVTLPPTGATPATTTVPPPKEIVAPPPAESPPAVRSEARSEARKAAKAPAPEAPAGKFGAQTITGRRWPWIVLTVLALLILTAQAMYRYRADLAALWPDARPVLERACAALKCTVALPRHVEQISIDASDLQVDTGHANLMLLTATLKNRAAFAQEYPSLALTLTDAQDQPLARRVLTPADYLDKKADSSAGFAANAELALKVFIDSREIKATGYRLFLFYP